MERLELEEKSVSVLLAEVMRQTGQGKTEAIVAALELYLKNLAAQQRAENATKMAKRIHKLLPKAALGKSFE